MTQTSKCKHWDCGWCYAPEGCSTNSEQGACVAPYECEEYLDQQEEDTEK